MVFVAVGVAGGFLGSLVGLGGGVFIVPLIVLFMGVPIHQAVAASLVAIVASSTASTIGYLRDDYSNIRLGLTLETATTLGAVSGGLTAHAVSREALSALFGVVLALGAVYLFFRRGETEGGAAEGSDTGRWGGRYDDRHSKREVRYRVRRLPAGLAASFIAGNLSGLLGFGGGPIQIPVMTAAMGIPMKAAAATSNFMIGVTACASAVIYYAHGTIVPSLTVPLVLGVTAGAFFGSRLAPRVRGRHLTAGLAVILLLLSIQMLLAAFGVRIR
ncbi:MAG TPA: hypothetical protein DD417_05995 [Elusimicrobia bacterium]|nr:hypothetical protein [Elusimicrobiota bacterium]